MNILPQIEAKLRREPEQDEQDVNAKPITSQDPPAVRVRLPSHASEICDTCTKLLEILKGEPGQGVSFPDNLAELQELQPLSCRFCYLRWQIMPPIKRKMVRDCSRVEVVFFGNNESGLLTITYFIKGDHYSMTLGYAPCTHLEQPGTDSSSPLTFSMINDWIHECHHNHERCGNVLQTTLSASAFPAGRILDLEPDGLDLSASTDIRLVDGRELKDDSKYISLSHRWGDYEPLKLTKETEEDFKNGIHTQTLPKLFMDAIDIARRLGIKYLWIDSLCIVQDDEDDWKIESAKMGQIYERSWLNIAAVKAQDAREGCYAERETWNVTPVVAHIPFQGATHHHYSLFNSRIWDVNVHDTSLMRRAWVQQEQLFSRRTLYFAQDQVFWRCQQTTACEMFPEHVIGHGQMPLSYQKAHLIASLREGELIANPDLQQQLPEDRLARNYAFHEYYYLDPPIDHPQRERIQAWKLHLRVLEIWSAIITQYSSCEMTFPAKDKIVAISALARRCGPASDYLAGLWRSTLPWQLLWSVKDNWKRQAHSRLSEPSWSWTSVHRGVRMHDHLTFHYDLEHDKPLIEVLEAETRLVGDDPFGHVDGGHITLAGFLIKTKISIMFAMVWEWASDFSKEVSGFICCEDDLGKYMAPPGLWLQPQSPDEIAPMFLDSSPSGEKYLEDFFGYYLPILRGPYGWNGPKFTAWEGLWLEPTGRRPGEYRRRGYFLLPLEMPKYWPEEFQFDQMLEVEEYEQYEGKHGVGDGDSPQMCHRYRITIV